MTPEPKPQTLTAEQCEAWLGMDNHRWSIEGSKFTAGVEAIATGKTKVVPVRSEAEWIDALHAGLPPAFCVVIEGHALWRIPEKDARNITYGWISALRSLGLVAATRDA